jgi:hydroxymethylglutaryl-CoA synthase
MIGIVSYGAYIPIYRLSLEDIAKVWGSRGGKGEKAVANCDEDSLTMGVEAARDCLLGIDRNTIEGLYFASTTPPYREKQTASIMAAVLDLGEDAFTSDFTGSLRSGTNAIRAAVDSVRAGSARNVLVVVADCRLPAPDSASETLFGDGAAAFLIGASGVALAIEEMFSTTSAFIDVWRTDKDHYPRTGEGRFVLTHGYLEITRDATLAIMKKQNLKQQDIEKAVFSAPNLRAHMTMAKMLGFDYGRQVQDAMFSAVGHTGASHGPMILAAAVEDARSGDRILFSNYGDGCDCFVLKTTDQVEKLRNRRGIRKNLISQMKLPNYGKYLHFRDMLEWEADKLPPSYSSLTTLWRDRKQILSLIGNKCRDCGKVQIDFPVQRVCAWCQSRDNFEEAGLAEKSGTLFSFSMDERTRDLDLPSIMAVVDFEEGARFMTVMTDRDPAKIEVGMPLEMTLRKFHEGQGLHNYFWKCRPVRDLP